MEGKKFRIKNKKDFWLGIVFAVFGIVYLIGAVQLPFKGVDALGAGFLPKIIGILAIVCGAILAVTNLEKAAKETGSEKEGEVQEWKTDYKRVVLSLILLTVSVLLLDYVGFIIIGAVYLFLQIMILSPKEKMRPVIYAVISIVLSIAVYLLFVRAFHVMLPNGILKGIL